MPAGIAPRIVLFGATGYTGGLTAEALVRRGESPLLAGRSTERLQALAKKLDAGLETATADVDDPDSIRALLNPGDVLLTTVGPFTRWGNAAATAAIAARAHYVDSTGEAAFIRRVFDGYGPAAERAGVAMLTAFGNDWVPGNLAGALALSEAGDSARRVDIGYFTTGGGAGGGFSAGTRASTVATLGEPAFAWREGRIVSERGGRRVRSFEVAGRNRDALSVGGTEHFGLPRIEPRLREVNVYLGWFGKATRALQIGGAGMTATLALPGAKRLYDFATSRLVKGSGGGPDAAARASARSIFVACAYDESGHQLSEVRVEGGDGYTLTGELLAWGAGELLRDGALASGALAPVDAFGLERLREGCATAGLQATQPAPASA
ncbi:MAG: hypothetical protein QOJ38_1292 [Solirubrobacterales bacterium]|jgi:short subunit dehydrogenase-like uncharacterized protein|nr:hypothetical protein [Solirubrobacterales bacterium]